MSIYKVNTPDGRTHVVEAYTHVRDSNGLTLVAEGGKQVAMFPAFNWMLVSEAEKSEEQAPANETPATDESSVTSPAASGE